MITNILEYLEHSAEKYPDKTAFADEHTACSYQELLHKSMGAGSALANKTKPRKPIAVFMEKGVPAITAFMSCVYAGCFYVMLDTKQPASRIEQILETLDAELLITDTPYLEDLKKISYKGTVLTIEELLQAEADEALLHNIRKQSQDIDPLYCIFTSGSTGVPKGVLVGHRSVIDFMECFTELFHFTPEDVIGNQAPFDFDVSVKDIYATLKTGATMQIIPKRFFSFPTQLLDFLCERDVTSLTWAVSALCIITTLHGFEYKVPQKINKVLFSGEVMPIKHLNEWQRYLPNVTYVNLYGPTEITCNCTYYVIDRDFAPGDVLPMGKAFPNEKVFLLDEHNQEVHDAGVQGEVCVSGTALSLGYYHNPEQTAKAFVQNPLNTCYPETIYRTGDLAYYNEDGEFCFATRKDFQIKHMGHRIELGEVEAAMEKVPDIHRVCCLFDTRKNKIVAFYEGDIQKKEIVAQLRREIPDFMIPNVFRMIEQMPLTKNGKIDRQMLKKNYEEDPRGKK